MALTAQLKVGRTLIGQLMKPFNALLDQIIKHKKLIFTEHVSINGLRVFETPLVLI